MEEERRLLALLEPDQIVHNRRALSRRRLTIGTSLLLAFLRVYVTVAIGLVAYAFWRAVHY